jgi:hypothetical protein
MTNVGVDDGSSPKWTLAAVGRRRKALAKMMGENAPGHLLLWPADELEWPGYLCLELIYNKPLITIAWEVVALRIARSIESRTIIDHAWLLDHLDGTAGFVIELYLSDVEASDVIRVMRRALKGWGVTVEHLPSARSAWNPGHTDTSRHPA